MWAGIAEAYRNAGNAPFGKRRNDALLRAEEPEVESLYWRLTESHQELLELEELRDRCEPRSAEHYRIQAALNERYYVNEEFLSMAERFESLHGKLSTIRERVLDWEARRDAEVLSGSLSSLELEDSPCSSPLSPTLPPLPSLPPGRPSTATLRSRATKTARLNPDALDFVPAAKTGRCSDTPAVSPVPTPSPSSAPTRSLPTQPNSLPKNYGGKRTPLRSLALMNLQPYLQPLPLIPLATYPVKAASFSPLSVSSPLPPQPLLPINKHSKARKRLQLRS